MKTLSKRPSRIVAALSLAFLSFALGAPWNGIPLAFANPALPSVEDLYPSLRQSTPRIQILNEMTPIHGLPVIEQELRIAQAGTLLIKRDDQSTQLLGGNKARKLEYLMGEAKARGAKSLITSGMWGSNHALATTIAARQQGYRIHLHLGPQPVTEAVRKKLLALHALGADLHFHSTSIGLGFAILKAMIADALSGGTVFHIPPGGSSPTGSLGYVNGYLEVVQQFKSEGRELPERIVVPVGSMGTAAGLLVGTCLAGHFERVKMIGIGVSDPLLSNESQTRKHAIALHAFIKDRITPQEREQFPECDYLHSQKAFAFADDQYAPGYGAPSPAVEATIAWVGRTEQIHLDGTYSGKAMNWLVEAVRKEVERGTPVSKTLFWLTYNSYDLTSVIQGYPWKNRDKPWLDLPQDFHKLFTEPQT